MDITCTHSVKWGLFLNNPVIYGRNYQYKCIVERLLSRDKGIPVCCIYAKSGFGKTSLAHLVYNDPMVVDYFDIRVWVCVSEEVTINTLMLKIIESVTHVCITSTTQSFLQEIVEQKIRDKRLLLVMDDADVEDELFWEQTLSILSTSTKGSMLLMTTKSDAVVGIVKPTYCCPLKGLTEEHCLSIFNQYCSKDGYINVQDLGNKVSVLSGGSPLYMKALSAYLCHAKPHDLLLIKSLKDDMILTLALCFHTLPQHLKRFCTFSSSFPKGHIFVKHGLVRLWAALDYNELAKRGEPEDIATEDLNELFFRSFFQHSPPYGFERDQFAMHELMYDVVKEVSGTEYLRAEHISSNVSQSICCLTVNRFEHQTILLDQLPDDINLQCLLNVSGSVSDSGLQDYVMSFPTLKLEGLNGLLMKSNALVILDLSYSCIDNLPASIESLKNLRHLAVNCTEINCLPSEIGSMKELLTLQAKDCPRLFELPQSMTGLMMLRHLDVRKDTEYVSMPAGLGKLTNIQTLEVFSVGNGPMHCSIEELKNLESLKGSIRITGLENVKDAKLAREASLGSKMNLKSLTLQWQAGMNFDVEDVMFAEKVLDGLQPHHYLQELTIKNYPGYSFPDWIGDVSFFNLHSIALYGCYNCSNFPELGKLPSLKNLSIVMMFDVQKLRRSSLASNNSSTEITGEFQALEQFKMWEMYDLEDFSLASEADMKQLRTLSVSRCPNLKSLPSLSSLVNLSLHCCPNLNHIPDFPSLKSLTIEGFQGVEAIVLSPYIPVLKKFEIINCNNLVTVHGLSHLTSIEKLTVERCPKIDLVANWKRYHFSRMSETRYGAIFSALMDLEAREKRHTYGVSKEAEEAYKRKEVTPMKTYIQFTYRKLRECTKDFDDTLRIGDSAYAKAYRGILKVDEGGDGIVYKRILQYITVAVKVLDKTGIHGAREFNREVEILSKIRHPNVVTLIGACRAANALVYEFLPNGSLEDHLQWKNKTSPLLWGDRVRIAAEICRALIFLHSIKPVSIIHGNLKPENILLDLNYVSKLADFGVYRLFKGSSTRTAPFNRTVYMTTGNLMPECDVHPFGYLDPNYLTTGKLTTQSDVYSFGLVLLRLLTGKEVLMLKHFVKVAMSRDCLHEMLDRTAGDWPLEDAYDLADIALRCCSSEESNRPDLANEVLVLLEDILDPSLPPRDPSSAPTYFKQWKDIAPTSLCRSRSGSSLLQ